MEDRANNPASRASGLVAGSLLIVALVTSGALAKRAAESGQVEGPTTEALAGLVRAAEVSTIATSSAVSVAEMLAAVGDELSAGQPILRRERADEERELAQLVLDMERATEEVAHRERTVAWLEESEHRLAARGADAPGELALAERDAQQVPMRQAKDSPERAQVAYDQAGQRERRLEELAAAGLVPRQDVEDARFARRIAADDLANARQAEELAKRVRTAEAAQARARRELALAEQRRQAEQEQASLNQARLQLRTVRLRYDIVYAASADPFIRAPRDCTILELSVSPGDRLPAGALVAKVARLDPLAVEVDVPPLLANRLHVGDTARVDIPAVAMVGRDGRVKTIAPLPNDAGKYVIQVVFSNPAHAKLAGQTAHVRFALTRGGQR